MLPVYSPDLHLDISNPFRVISFACQTLVNSKRKGNNKTQQSIVSFNPTLINPPATDAESSQRSVNGKASPGPIAVIRPFLKGIEQDSVFIDLTPVKDRNLLNKALLKLNEASIADGMYEDFLGYRSKPRHYFGHAFLETMWLMHSEGRKTLIEDNNPFGTLEHWDLKSWFSKKHMQPTLQYRHSEQTI